MAIRKCVGEIIVKGKHTYNKVCRNRAFNLYNKNDRFKDYMELYNRLIVKNNLK